MLTFQPNILDSECLQVKDCKIQKQEIGAKNKAFKNDILLLVK